MIRAMSKLFRLFWGGRPLIQTGGNLLFRNFPVGDESHGKDVDDRRAVVAGVGGDDGQEG